MREYPGRKNGDPLAPEANWLDALPRTRGFRMRGLATTRIETFTDAAFALALSLLVLASNVPASYPALLDALRGIPAFLLSATLLMVFWAGHHTFSRRYGLEDGPTIVLSCLLVFTVLVYVYPLRFVFDSMVVWFAYLLGFDMRSSSMGLVAGQVNGLFLVYGAGFVAMCGAIVLLNLHAWRLRDALALDTLERFDTRMEIRAWAVMAGAGVLSMLLAALLPPTLAGLPGWAYAPLSIVMPLLGRRVSRQRREILSARR
jgi:Endosomal/lysosomal potassium channel TMEM175